LCGSYKVTTTSFFLPNEPMYIVAKVQLFEADLQYFYQQGKVSKHRKYEKWFSEFKDRIHMNNENQHIISVRVNPNREVIYGDEILKDNPFIKEVLPPLNIINEARNLEFIESHLLNIHGFSEIDTIMKNTCIFDQGRHCTNCFDCIGYINKKTPMELTLNETFKLVNYQLYTANLKKYADSINKYFQSNYGSSHEINYKFNFDMESLLKVQTIIRNKNIHIDIMLKDASASMRSLYILSLFQTYLEIEGTINSIIMIEQPELHLHPELQKVASDIIYKLSKKNQVIFTTHSPQMIFNFSTKQIRHVIIDKKNHDTQIGKYRSIDRILDDLGYSASDSMDASFVFIVEGKDDRSRLPLILEKYYSEIRKEDGELNRIAIIPTNSCTNIKTYANLKFINRGYLKNNFMMIRDSDGKNPEALVADLCSYYERRIHDDEAAIPRIKPENVLVLKYYSIENYFLNPTIMTQLGIIQNETEFYHRLFVKYQQYLGNLKSGRNLLQKTGIDIGTEDDVRKHIEVIKTYIRGHNLFDIFYGKFRTKQEQMDVLKRYIDLAPREEFKDILEPIEQFVFFDNRKMGNTK
jgi:putative ATP-dependent endonuclease of the OLD family